MVGPPSIGPPQHMGPPSYPPPQVQYAMPMPPQPPQEAEKKKDEEEKEEEKKVKPKANRMVAGKVWHDESLEEWDTSDFRCFVGDLGNEVSDDGLARAFAKYTSMQKAKVVRDKRNSKSRGYGFVSFKDPNDFMKAMKEMNGKYIGNRPIKMRKSSWKERDFGVAKKRQKKKEELLGKKSVGKNKGKNRAAMKFS